MIYTVTFNPALDYVITLTELLAGEMNRAKDTKLLVGGKGINVSLVLRNLGTESKALGFVAGFTGEEIVKRLREKGLFTDFIRLREGESRINVKVKANEETELNANGPCIRNEEVEALFEKLDSLKCGDYLVLAGSIPSSIPDTIYETIMQKMSGRGVHFVVDASGELLMRALKYQPFLIKPNKAELEELCGRALQSREAITEAAMRLKAQGAKNVLVSLAGEGAVLVTETGELYDKPAAKGTIVNSVGAGDSMVAGFLAGFLERGDYEYAMRLGMSAGSASAFSSELATQAQVQKWMEEWYAGV